MRWRNGGGFVFKLMVMVLSLLFVGCIPDRSGPGVAGEVYATGAAEEWEASAEGLPWGEVYYQIALPEIQGIAEPVFVAGQGTYVDDLTGAEVTAYVPVPERVERVARRARA